MNFTHFLRARVVSPWVLGHLLRAPCIWQPLAPVHGSFGNNFLRFYVQVNSEVLALFAENLDIISRSLHMEVGGGLFIVFSRCFSDSVHLDVESRLSADFLRALDGQQLFVIEGWQWQGRREFYSQVTWHGQFA